jgi:methanobactin biosynthesis MbnP-like protein
MKTFKYTLLLFLSASLVITSCKKDPDEEQPVPAPAAPTTGSLALHFENMVDTNELVFNTQSYVTANNDTFTVSAFKYYISNIVLTKSGGGTYVETESYHLINAADSNSCGILLANVPFGNYTSISFMIGVDSARNCSGAQTGALDPTNGMFWSWSTGYIQAKLEGHSPQSTSSGQQIVYHVGGFKGMYDPLKTVSPSFGGDMASVSSAVTPEIHFKADVAEWFKSPNLISISTTSFNMSVNQTSLDFSDNYADMFSVEHIHN